MAAFEIPALTLHPARNHPSKRVAERLGAIYARTFELRGSTYEHWVHHRREGKP